jgi:LruC domain-containing protein
MKTILKKLGLVIIAAAVVLTSCQKDEEFIKNNSDVQITKMEDLKVSENFSFKTTKEVVFSIKTLDFAGKPMPNVVISSLTPNSNNKTSKIFTAVTDAQGVLQFKRELPSYYKEVVLSTMFLGYPSEVNVPIINGRVEFTYGGLLTPTKSSTNIITPQSTNPNHVFLGNITSDGAPTYLAGNDIFDSQFLSNVNATLPEQRPVPTYNPQYIAQGTETDVKLVEACDVWVTFVSEGAGYKNVLGFYTYNLNNPPTSPSQIGNVTIVFPNASMTNSGGGLNPGNKVKIGTFPAGTGIGWVLISDGWRNNMVTGGYYTLYSNPQFNPESNPTLRRHNVYLYDQGRNLFLIGFEDIRRDQSSDNDFNDLVFYVKSNPITAIEKTNTPPVINTLPDTDGDGVSDPHDEYPNDPNKAFNNYYPNSSTYGTLAFEDLWPSVGDYDFNDVVVDYRFNQITNAQNKVVEIKGTIIPRATGAGFENGLGFELPVSNTLISSVSGYKLMENYINLSSNGTEAGNSNAVVIAFDNAYRTFKNVRGANNSGIAGINTTINGLKGDPDTLKLTITLNNPVSMATLGNPPYNQFIIKNKQRGYEIHLPDMPPTALANTSIFGTVNDRSVPPTKYYRNENNLPWAINIAEKFEYPIEKVQIIQAYNKFATWAQSSGILFPDWYKLNYRNNELIYK